MQNMDIMKGMVPKISHIRFHSKILRVDTFFVDTWNRLFSFEAYECICIRYMLSEDEYHAFIYNVRFLNSFFREENRKYCP